MLSFFPRGVLDEILNLIESVSEEFPSYFYMAITIGMLHNTFTRRGSPVAQWIERWPANPAVPYSTPLKARIFSTVNRAALHTAVYHHSPIVLIRLFYC